MGNENPSIAILLVLYNQAHYLADFYNSLARQDYKSFKIFFVDNRSHDNPITISEELNKKLYFDIEYISPGYNTGYAEGNNIAAKIANTANFDFLLVSNTDIEFQPGFLTSLLSVFKIYKDAGIAGPVLYSKNSEGKYVIQSYGLQASFLTQSKRRLFHKIPLEQNSSLPPIHKVDFIGGSVCMIPSEVYKKIGLFEQDYFMYNEELDFAYRLKNAGYSAYCTSKAVAFHNTYSKTDNPKRFHFEHFYNTRNRYLYFYKFKLYYRLPIQLLKDIFIFPILFKGFLKRFEFTILKYHYLGIINGLAKRNGRNARLFSK